jgi:hypothetical protein
VFFVLDIVVGDNWQMVLQKEPCSKCMVVEINELLPGVDIAEQGGDEGKDILYRTNMGQETNGECGEKILTTNVQCFDAKLQMVCENNGSKVEG